MKKELKKTDNDQWKERESKEEESKPKKKRKRQIKTSNIKCGMKTMREINERR